MSVIGKKLWNSCEWLWYIVKILFLYNGFWNIYFFNVIYFAVIYTFHKSSPSGVEKNSLRDAHKKRALFYCFISLTKTMSGSLYTRLNAKMDFQQITYFTDINWQKMAKRGADVSARDIMFAHLWLFSQIRKTKKMVS